MVPGPMVYVAESGFPLDEPEIEGALGKSRLVKAIGAITDFKLLNVGLFDTDINADVF